ncbi:hypothetical protein TNCV_1282031 [Trichonephila clavipes]|uniref:Uncharacterized protein n=1 Tax=Trichonephila clavipes TaxID=2585209 RepID=A0A8X6SQF9_TRICX|nr:hypothetical protein TNCV_1282031 [Trichonephila clavipes]
MPYYVFIEFLKRNLTEIQNTDQKRNLSLAITQEEKLHTCYVITDNRLTEKREDKEFEVRIGGQTVSDTNFHLNTDTISNEMDITRSFQKFCPSTHGSNAIEASEQISAHFSEITLAQNTKYAFYDDNEEEIIIDNANFEEEEVELINIFHSSSNSLSNTSNIEVESYNETIHFKPISQNASTANSTEEIDIIDNKDFEEEKYLVEREKFNSSPSLSNTSNVEMSYCNESISFKLIPPNVSTDTFTGKNNSITNANHEVEENVLMDALNSHLASLSNSSNSGTGYYNEAFQFSPTPTDASPDDYTD